MVRRSERDRGTAVKWILIGVLLLAVIVVIAQNTDEARLDILMFNVTWPLWLLLTVVALVAFAAGWFSGRLGGRANR